MPFKDLIAETVCNIRISIRSLEMTKGWLSVCDLHTVYD